MNCQRIMWSAKNHKDSMFPEGTLSGQVIRVGQNLSNNKNEGVNK